MNFHVFCVVSLACMTWLGSWSTDFSSLLCFKVDALWSRLLLCYSIWVKCSGDSASNFQWQNIAYLYGSPMTKTLTSEMLKLFCKSILCVEDIGYFIDILQQTWQSWTVELLWWSWLLVLWRAIRITETSILFVLWILLQYFKFTCFRS